jgi:hypothetical protein
MGKTGIDWDEYDHGVGSEEFKRQIAKERTDYERKHGAMAELQRAHQQIAELEAEVKRLRNIIEEIKQTEAFPWESEYGRGWEDCRTQIMRDINP